MRQHYMIDLENIRNFTSDQPGKWSLFGLPEDFDALPETHKAQILFLNKEAGEYLYGFVADARLLTGDLSAPFAGGNFRQVEKFSDFSGNDTSKQHLKKWLFKRGIPFSTWVFVLPNGIAHPILTTWKMVINYSGTLFMIDDILVFDKTLNWCLFFFHEDDMFFGKDNIYDPSNDYKRMEELNERKKKYPEFKHPYL